jgi:hypothetical protein
MIEFTIKRLHQNEQDETRIYHVFNRDGGLRLVADYGSPWLPEESNRFVRFARPNGKTIATMDLAATPMKTMGGRHSQDYAIVVDHAVYAIFSEYHVTDEDEHRLYFVLRVGEKMWLALREEYGEAYYTIYNHVPPSFISRSVEPMFSDLPEPDGQIEKGMRQFDYAITWHEESFKHPATVTAALIFLIDRQGDE